ncbi:hypothetical protein HPB51_007633 [Rhipicephalus microplus]|uniref:Uncharacterized protein n=1 Tax=Rhipicephalus microplus TaxID=6941 RepID=A0A9J6ERZ3_RHIMP|nr:hypothetical protein HPB51_007633 [Rhipicephalus microplus]
MKTDRRREEPLPPGAGGNVKREKKKRNTTGERKKNKQNGRASRKSQQRLSSSGSCALSLSLLLARNVLGTVACWQLARSAGVSCLDPAGVWRTCDSASRASGSEEDNEMRGCFCRRLRAVTVAARERGRSCMTGRKKKTEATKSQRLGAVCEEREKQRLRPARSERTL